MGAKTAPLRQVLQVTRSGVWGNTSWRHELECGHVVTRKRQAPRPALRCVSCETMKMLDQVETWDNSAQKELNAERLRLALASRLGITPEEVAVVMSPTSEILGMSIHLSPATIRRLTG